MSSRNILKKRLAFLLLSLALPLGVQSAEIIQVGASGTHSQSVLGSTVVPYKEVTLSARYPGVVRYVAGEVGAYLQQGGIIFQVDDSALRAKRAAVVAQVNNARTAWQNSQSQYQRELVSPRSKDVGAMPGFAMPSMFDQMAARPFANSFMGGYDSDAVRQSDLSNAISGVAQAQGQYQAAMAQLQEIDAALRDANAVAPFEGMIMEKRLEVGDTVQPGQPLVRFGLVKQKRLQADVPAGLVGSLQKGMWVPARIAGGKSTSVRVAEIYPVADSSRHTVTVKFDVPADIEAAPGMYAEVHLPDTRHNAGNGVVTIPETALLAGSSLPGVLLVGDNGSSLRLVRLGSRLSDGNVEVISGLQVGDRVIGSPPPGAQPGWMPSSQ